MIYISRLLLIAVLTVLFIIQASNTEAVAYVRVVQDGEVWWFEDGQGRRFFSLGVNCIGGCFGHAEELPMEPSRRRRIVSFLKSEGFNTAAGWSSPSVWADFYVADQIYTGFQEERHDAFDDALWKERFEPCIREEVKPFLGKENFIGYFVDNEPRWNPVDIFQFYLSLSGQRPGSRAFTAFLKSFYKGSIQALNREWDCSYGGFEEIPESPPPKRYSTAMQQGVLKAWRNEAAKAYYRRYLSLLRSLDPHHLVLGVRYRSIPDLDLFKTLSPLFDVDSVNQYNRYGNLKPEFQALYKASGKPLLISEFSFSGFPEPGRRSMLFVDVYSQENRGIGYQKYVLEAARAPFMVGMHWFFWMDYPMRDESDGGFLPDQNVGLVTTDESWTYGELADWIKQTNREVHAAHAAARSTVPSDPPPLRKSVRRFTPKVDGYTSEWPEQTAVKPSEIESLRDAPSLRHTYFISQDDEALYIAGDVSDSHLDQPGGEWAWTGDYIFLHLSPGGPPEPNTPEKLSLSLYPGGGPAGAQPSAVRWDGFGKSKAIPSVVAKRVKEGGFSMEAKIPWSSLEDFKPSPASSWMLTIGYQNTNEIYLASWRGVVVFPAR